MATMEINLPANQSTSHLPLLCHICGDIARGLNFNVITCMSCKAFFRRNAHRRSILQCQFDNGCPVTKKTRSYCSACRLEKCFTLGMDEKMIRCIPNRRLESRRARKLEDTTQEVIPPSKLSSLDLLRTDRSTLTSEQWNLISNFINVYDEQNSVIKIKHLLAQLASLPPKLRVKSSEASYMVSHVFSGIQPFIEHLLHIHCIPLDARKALVKHNIHTTGAFSGLFLFRELDLSHNSMAMNVFTAFYGSDVMRIATNNSDKYDQNGNLIKIFIFLLIFSGNCSIVNFDDQEDIPTMSSSIHRIQIQHIYVTAFWKYLLYLYGSDEATVRFTSMIQLILNVLYITEMVSNNINHHQMLDSVITQTERCLIIKD